MSIQSLPSVNSENLPYNLEIEQSLLGAMLAENRVCVKVRSFLQPEHFYEALHGRIYGVIRSLIDDGAPATLHIVRDHLSDDAAFAEMGGIKYLTRLVTATVMIEGAEKYGRHIHDLATRRQIIECCQSAELRARHPKTDDPVAAIASEMQYALGQMEISDQRKAAGFGLAVREALDRIQEAQDDNRICYTSGLRTLDRALRGGYTPTDLIVVGARPAMGKSALAFHSAIREAEAGNPVLFFSLEMSRDQLAQRAISSLAEVDSQKFEQKNGLDELELERLDNAARKFSPLHIIIEDQPDIKIEDIRVKARAHVKRMGVKAIFIDHLHLISASNSYMRGIEKVTHITQQAKMMAKELNVPVILLAQLNRGVEQRDDKRPTLADLRESGSIEQDADIVMFLYRDEYYLERETDQTGDWMERMADAEGKAEIIIAKNRHGPTGKVEVGFWKRYTKFGDLAWL